MRLKRFIATTMAVSMLVLGTMASVSAGNTTKRDFTFTVTSDKKSTIPQSKVNDSSAMIRIVSGTGAATVIVNGLKTSTSSTMTDLTYGTYKTVRKSDTYTYLPNLVYETKDNNGNRIYPYANLSLRSAEAASWNASGKWSPDSK